MSYENKFSGFNCCQYATNAPADIFPTLQPNPTRLESDPEFYVNTYAQQLRTPYTGFMVSSTATANASAYPFQTAIFPSLCSQAEGAPFSPNEAPSFDRTAWLPFSTYIDPFDNSGTNSVPLAATSTSPFTSRSVWPATPDEQDVGLGRVPPLTSCLVLNVPEHTLLDPEKALALAQSLRTKDENAHDPLLVQFLSQLERVLQTDTPLVSAFGLLLWQEGLRSVSKELSGMWDRFLGRVVAFQKSRRMGERKRARCPRPIKGNKRSTSFLRRNGAHAFDQQPNSCGRRMSIEVLPSRGLRNQHLRFAPPDEPPIEVSVDRRAQQKRAEKAARERERRRRHREARKAQSPAPDLDALRAKLETLRKAAGISEKDAQRCYSKFDFSPVTAKSR